MTEPGPAEPIQRLLPQPSISSEPFWASGADGRLRTGARTAAVTITRRSRSVRNAAAPG
ncbi:MAG: hypothetical protein QOD59_4384 [Mycobacterium sp.]|nr:hypothetical protein [Mycobacterium sp.]